MECEQYCSKGQIEFLPNELLFLIFDYLYCDEIVYAFQRLNHRFQTLLHQYSVYHLNHSDEITKLRFHCIEQLQLDVQHVKSLTLSHNLNIFQNNPLEFFYPKLQSLSLVDSNASETISLIYLLPNFKQLKVLSISHRSLNRNDIREIILFQIKTLKHFIWNVRQSFFDETLQTISADKSSIEYYEFYSLQISQIEWLNYHTLNLKSLRISYPNYFCGFHRQQTFDGLVSLFLDQITSINDVHYLLIHLPGLIHLRKLVLQGHCWSDMQLVNGSKWKEIIQQAVPSLQIFRFFFILYDAIDFTKHDELIETFRTDFWLIEKKWFITCDYEASCGSTYFYTLPCIKSALDYSHSRKQISTRQRTFADTKHIRQLNLYAIKSQHIQSFDRLNYVQSLTLNSCNHNLTFNQLNQIVKISSVKHINLRSNISDELFCQLFQCHPQLISVEIDYDQLTAILQNIQENHKHYLKNIKFLKIRRQQKSSFHTQDLQNLHSYFPDLKKLVVKRPLRTSDIEYLLNSFQYLSILVVDCYEDSFESNVSTITNKKIIYQSYNKTLCFLIE